ARTLPAALAGLDQAVVALREHPEYAGLELDADGEAAFVAEAAALVEQYFRLEDPTTITPIGIELKLEVELAGIRLRGVIDRLELDADGELVVTDYKTGSVPSEMHENARLAGVHIYALLCERMLGRRPSRVQLYFLSKPEAIIARPTEQSVAGVERKTNAVWAAIARACERDDFRPSPGPLCDYCTFKPYCPAYGGDPLQAVELRGPGTAVPAELPLAPAATG
ncbi:MAG: RecB family exonuclease, partial [Acidimicrobiia bacterium]